MRLSFIITFPFSNDEVPVSLWQIYSTDILVRELKRQSHHNVNFQTNTLGNGMNPVYS